MTDQIPPMPDPYVHREVSGLGDACAADAVEELKDYARDLAARLAASQALAGELAEALEKIRARGNVYGSCPFGNHLKMPWELWQQMDAALTHYREATR